MSEAPLAILRERLADFRATYAMCDYIDYWPDLVRCREINQRHIDRLSAAIAEMEAKENAA